MTRRFRPLIPLAALIPLFWCGCTTMRLPPKMSYATTTTAESSGTWAKTAATSPSTSTTSKAPGGGPYTLKDTDLSSELMGIHNIKAGVVDLNDTVYVVPSEEWLVQKFLPYFANFRRELRLTHRGDGLDCDNFSAIFRNQLVFSNIASGREIKGDVPCGILEVQQKEGFGTVRSLGDGFHSLVLIRTDKGWMVVEPQDNTFAPLTEYPNRDRIAYVYF